MERKDFSLVEKNLISLGYKVSCFETAGEASEYINSQIDGQTVGFAGSVTLNEIGLYDLLASHNQVFWHARIPEGMTPDDIRSNAALADVYISSVNGLSENGEIVNIDGNCNRVASIFYGHKRVFLVVGENKLAKDYDEALWRARNIAAPKNAQRLGMKTPCAAKADRCYNCSSPERICRGLSVLWCKPRTGEYEVVLVHQPLGY